jgi:hypothetical protein
MGIPHVKNELERRSSKNITIGLELAEIIKYLCDNGHVQGGNPIGTDALTSGCQEATYNRLRRLIALGFVQKIDNGANNWIIQTRTGDFLGQGEIRPALNEEIRRLRQHMKSDATVKKLVAGALRTTPSRATTELTSGGIWEVRSNLEDAVEAIEDYPGVSTGPYGKVIVRKPENEYLATTRAELFYNE